MFRHTLKILQPLLQDFKSVSDYFWTLCIKGLRGITSKNNGDYYCINCPHSVRAANKFKSHINALSS